MGVTVEHIEEIIRETLEQDAELARYVKRFLVLPDLSEDQLVRLIKDYPAVAVIAYEGYWEENATSTQDETGVFAVLCVNKNLRAPHAALAGAAAGEIGLYDIVEGVRKTLSKDNAVQFEGLLSCRPLKRKLVRADGATALYSVEVEVRWRRNSDVP